MEGAQHAGDPRQERSRRRSRSRALREDPRLDPAGRAAAGALRRDGAAAARRRRHRPAPPRHAFPRLRAVGRHRHRDAPARIPRAKLKGADVFLDEPSVTATENALVAAVAADGTTICATPPPSRMCRTSRISWSRSAPRSRASAPTPSSCTGRRRLAAPRYSIQPDHIEVGSSDRARRGDALAAAHREGRRRASALDPVGLRTARHRLRRRGRRPRRALQARP